MAKGVRRRRNANSNEQEDADELPESEKLNNVFVNMNAQVGVSVVDLEDARHNPNVYRREFDRRADKLEKQLEQMQVVQATLQSLEWQRCHDAAVIARSAYFVKERLTSVSECIDSFRLLPIRDMARYTVNARRLLDCASDYLDITWSTARQALGLPLPPRIEEDTDWQKQVDRFLAVSESRGATVRPAVPRPAKSKPVPKKEEKEVKQEQCDDDEQLQDHDEKSRDASSSTGSSITEVGLERSPPPGYTLEQWRNGIRTFLQLASGIESSELSSPERQDESDIMDEIHVASDSADSD